MSASAPPDLATLVPEDAATLRKIKAEICRVNLHSDDRLSTNERAGDFALRYVLMSLFRDRQVRSKQKQRTRRRRRRNG